MDERNPVVTVYCICYNHAKYLRKALDSVVCQKTDFPFEVLVHDDASTDGSAQIILEYQEKYPDLIVPVLQKENLFSRGINKYSEYLLPITHGKYVAQLECDDFWCDEHKLQKQVDALKRNSDCVACVHYTALCNEQGQLTGKVLPLGDDLCGKISQERIVENVAKDNMFHYSSRMFQTAIIKMLETKKPYWAQPSTFVGDTPQMLFVALQGSLYCIPEIMSTYRMQSEGSYSNRIEEDSECLLRVRKELREMWSRFGSEFPLFEKYTNPQVEWYDMAIMEMQLQKANFREFCRFKRSDQGKKQYLELGRKTRVRIWVGASFPWLRPAYRKFKQLLNKGES